MAKLFWCWVEWQLYCHLGHTATAGNGKEQYTPSLTKKPTQTKKKKKQQARSCLATLACMFLLSKRAGMSWGIKSLAGEQGTMESDKHSQASVCVCVSVKVSEILNKDCPQLSTELVHKHPLSLAVTLQCFQKGSNIPRIDRLDSGPDSLSQSGPFVLLGKCKGGFIWAVSHQLRISLVERNSQLV